MPSEPAKPTLLSTLVRYCDELRKRFPLPVPTSRKPRKTVVAATLLLILAAGVAWLDPCYRTEHYSTAIGGHHVVDLADGSRLTLDTDTHLNVSWHLRSRHVELATGQALFNVNKTLFRPFLVEAGTVQIKVLGTKFNVLRDDDSVRVALVRGSVNLQSTVDPMQELLRVPGEQIEVRQGRFQPVAKVDVTKVLAWRDRRLVFTRTPLLRAIAQIQRYRQAPIVLDDPLLEGLRISGVFDTNNVEDLLNLLPHILPLALSRDNDGTLHITHKTAKK